MDARKRAARIAGLWYLAMAVSGPIGIAYVAPKILVEGDASATWANIVAHELLLRVGVVSSLVCQVSFVFLVLALKRLFQGVNDTHARLMVALVIAAVPIGFLNEIFPLAALELATDARHWNGLAPEQRSALALLLLKTHRLGFSIAEIFWGLWLLPFSLLVIRSKFIPKVLGALLIASGASYLLESAIALLAPQHLPAASAVLTAPMAAGELLMVLWLLVKGVRTRAPAVLPADALLAPTTTTDD
jgi:hypothetical protein